MSLLLRVVGETGPETPLIGPRRDDCLRLTLPYPPSGQTRLGMRSGRFYRTAGYRRYLAEVLVAVRKAKGPRFPDGRLWVFAQLLPPTRRRADLDNAWKAIGDALAEARVYADDGQIDDLQVVRLWGKPNPSAIVTVGLLP